ncbi:hypothetical protein [Streptomyces sp. 8N706]|uniref:hypothetical protein n=1 Tax=Streptomyces sp. 8N706 TaxID=3457416 RepID=UPI003FD087DF
MPEPVVSPVDELADVRGDQLPGMKDGEAGFTPGRRAAAELYRLLCAPTAIALAASI